MSKQTFKFDLNTEKVTVDKWIEWIEEHDRKVRAEAINEYVDILKKEWAVDAILTATDERHLIAIFKRIAKQLKEN